MKLHDLQSSMQAPRFKAMEIGNQRLELVSQGFLIELDIIKGKRAEGIGELEKIVESCSLLKLPQSAFFYNMLAEQAIADQYIELAKEYIHKGKLMAVSIPEIWGLLLCTEAKILVHQGLECTVHIQEVKKIIQKLRALPKSRLGCAYRSLLLLRKTQF